MFGFAVLGMVAGCSDDHTRDRVDSGPVGDVGAVCRPGDPPPFSCLFVDGSHVCGDVAVQPSCGGGAWICPSGTSPDPTCWCSGLALHGPNCTCTPSGWSCVDLFATGAPDSPPFTCPDDPSTLVGQPCGVDQATCGSCADPCGGGICNEVQCQGGTWQHEFFGCPALGFPCGSTLYCERGAQYCERFQSDVAGEPDTWSCTDFPQDCPSTCACFAGTPGTGMCSESGGDVTITFAGG